MEFTALEPWKLIVLMLAGGVFSLAGLWLIFRSKTDGHSMVIHVAGMKLEAYSAGVLVFLIGTAFFATPVFVPADSGSGDATRDAPGVITTSGAGNAGQSHGKPDTANNEQDSTSSLTSVRAITLEGEEIEPNDTTARANVIPVGTSVTGTISGKETDVSRIDTSELKGATLYVTLSAGSGDLRLQTWLSTGKMLYRDQFGYGGSITFETRSKTMVTSPA